MRCRAALLLCVFVLAAEPALAQAPPSGPPAVGVVRAAKQPITETSSFIGRVQAVNRVDLVARVTGFLEQMQFAEGSEVKKGDVLFRIEQGPFQADVEAKQAAVAQFQAQLQNANATLERAQALLRTAAGQQSAVDAALAAQRSTQAQILGAQAQLRQSQINLGYTEIRAPVDGKIGRATVTVGNVVGPSSGTIATIVSQDPMYVTFPISVRSALELRERYAGKGGFSAVQIRIGLPDGRAYGQIGKLNFADNTISQSTDTIVLRGTIANPIRAGAAPDSGDRELSDGEFVTVYLEGVQPVEVLAVPRSAVLSDQQGNYVYVVGAENKAEQRRIQLGQSTPTTASVMSGLKEGDMVVVEGLQRVRPGQPVAPGPASPGPNTSGLGTSGTGAPGGHAGASSSGNAQGSSGAAGAAGGSPNAGTGSGAAPGANAPGLTSGQPGGGSAAGSGAGGTAGGR